MNQLLPWVWAFPLPFLLLNVFGFPKKPGQLSFVGPLAIFVVAVAYLMGDHQPVKLVFADVMPFLPDSALRFTIDGLAAVMLAVVGGVATCVFVYAISYMHDDERAHRFFAFLDFFVAAMCLLVVAGNLTVLLAGWTGVGIASFLLISFWWQRTGVGGGPLQAGFLALGANAIGDAALLVAAVALPKGGGALDTLATTAPQATGGVFLIGLCLVTAAAAKSAQGPLWFWLPSAMAGPTPVSALIHAATMVAAGVYLLVRVSPLLALSPEVMTIVVVTGMSTALLGGLASLWQTNFKRGIAYSTASQLGWMFVAVGIGAPFAAFFHLVTHAAFKAMLFLGAGTVIHATHHEEDIRKVGGLAKDLKLTHAFFVIGVLALIGTPLITAGGISKEAILAAAHHHMDGPHGQPWVFYCLLAGVFITGAYAGRLWFGIFHGDKGESSRHVHADHLGGFDLPLIPLAVGAIGLGYLEASTHILSGLLKGAVIAPAEVHAVPDALGVGAFVLGLAGVAAGVWLAKKPQKGLPVPPDALSAGLLAELRVVPAGVASFHTGKVGRYLLVTMLGLAIIAGLALRPPTTPLPKTATEAAPSKKKKAEMNPALRDAAKNNTLRPRKLTGNPRGVVAPATPPPPTPPKPPSATAPAQRENQ